MKIAISCVITEQTAGPGLIARAAEAMGFEGLFLPEHPVIPVAHRTRYPDPTSDGEIPEFYSHMPDPFVLLAMAAQATTHFKIATAICLVPRAQPNSACKRGRHPRPFFQWPVAVRNWRRMAGR